ncbi:MAG: hypothetical protein J6T15_04815 [Bacilli bacterium]|nr:hypothetical protein [Bacilli bacterium]
MFLRIDTDCFIRVDSIVSYKLYDLGDAFKVTFWADGGLLHNVIYPKTSQEQMDLLQEVVAYFRERTVNPEQFKQVQIPMVLDNKAIPTMESQHPEIKREGISPIQEVITDKDERPKKLQKDFQQMSLFDD